MGIKYAIIALFNTIDNLIDTFIYLFGTNNASKLLI